MHKCKLIIEYLSKQNLYSFIVKGEYFYNSLYHYSKNNEYFFLIPTSIFVFVLQTQYIQKIMCSFFWRVW